MRLIQIARMPFRSCEPDGAPVPDAWVASAGPLSESSSRPSSTSAATSLVSPALASGLGAFKASRPVTTGPVPMPIADSVSPEYRHFTNWLRS